MKLPTQKLLKKTKKKINKVKINQKCTKGNTQLNYAFLNIQYEFTVRKQLEYFLSNKLANVECRCWVYAKS